MSAGAGDGAPEPGPGATRTPRRAPGALVRLGDVGDPVTVVLVRHGQTELTARGAYSGSSVPGPGLNAAGRVEAARAADLVARIGRDAWSDLPRPSEIVASPMQRTRETATAVSRRLGLPVRIDPDFAEVNFGAWEGLTAPEIARTHPLELTAWHETGEQRAPGGESVADVGRRVARGLAALVATSLGRTVAVAAHTIVLRSAVGLALDAPVRTWNRLRIPPGSLVILRRWTDGVTEVTTTGYAPL